MKEVLDRYVKDIINTIKQIYKGFDDSSIYLVKESEDEVIIRMDPHPNLNLSHPSLLYLHPHISDLALKLTWAFDFRVNEVENKIQLCHDTYYNKNKFNVLVDISEFRTDRTVTALYTEQNISIDIKVQVREV